MVSFIIQGILWNVVFLVFCLIALARASKKKTYTGILVIGTILSAIPYIGTITGMSRRPDLDSVNSLIAPFVFFLILLVLFVRACSKAYKEEVTEDQKESQEETGKS